MLHVLVKTTTTHTVRIKWQLTCAELLSDLIVGSQALMKYFRGLKLFELSLVQIANSMTTTTGTLLPLAATCLSYSHKDPYFQSLLADLLVRYVQTTLVTMSTHAVDCAITVLTIYRCNSFEADHCRRHSNSPKMTKIMTNRSTNFAEY